MRKIAAIILAILILPSLVQADSTSGRAVNVDLTVGDISITYQDSTNRSKYQMFSSNYPIVGFNKPQNLYVTDGVLGVGMNINVEIENLGTSQSGFIDVQVYILHNEYTRFELLNQSNALTPIPGSSTSSTDFTYVPKYAGNHTVQISVSNSVGDDDTSNNQKSRHLTVAYSYDNCDDMSSWNVVGDWGTSADAYITSPSAFHIGNGQFSTYSASTTSTLTTPSMNLSDDANGHNAAIGYSFFYTGGANSGDTLKGYALSSTGTWDETFTIQGVVDNDFTDGSNNWQTFSATHNGRNSPLIPLTNDYFHSNSQFRFTFTSDSSGEDIGYYIDEFVIIYDQTARKSEYGMSLSGVNTFGGLPLDWSITRFSVENTGNISGRFTPSVYGVPDGWTHFFANTNGASISSSGIQLLPGEIREFDLRVLVDENASQGNIPIIVNITSNLYQDIQNSVQSSIKILPSRIPDIIVPEFTPRCKPGDTCQFPVEIRNIGEATDVFTISISDKNIPSGWSVQLNWNQSNSMLVRTDTPREIWIEVTVPSGIEPDVTAEAYLTATSTNDTRRTDTEVIDVAAAMFSNAQITSDETSTLEIDPGDFVDVDFRIWNNASRIDIFQPSIAFTDVPGWTVSLVNTPDLAISQGSSSTFTVRITAPITAQSGDVGPIISPKAISLRSGEEIIGDSWQGIKVNPFYNLSIELTNYPSTLTPGIPVQISLQITNHGNGQDTAIIDMPWSPNSWEWWALSEGVNVTNGLDLSAPFDLNEQKQVDLWILLPSLEAAGEVHELMISVISITGEEIYPVDNEVTFESITEIIKQPRLDGYFGESVVETNTTHTFNATAWNIGNAVDSSSKVKLSIQTSPPTNCVIGFLSTSKGQSKSSGEWLSLNLGPTQHVNITSDVIIGADCDLNTIISITLELEGGSDELGRPVVKKLSSVLMVGERRNVIFENTVPSTIPVENKDSQLIWINLTSTSTTSEIFDVSAVLPESWGLICDGVAIHLESSRIELAQGNLNPQIHNMRCELVRESGVLSGDVTILLKGADGRINHTFTEEYLWAESKSEDSLFSSQPILVGSIAIPIVLLLIFMLLRKRGNQDTEIFEDEKYSEDDVPLVGPPASSFEDNSSQSDVASEDQAMIEYQRQLEEYNRKMAEYQAWQAAQGSQPTAEPSHHE